MKPPATESRARKPKAVALGVRIRSARERTGYTQAELGSMLNVTENAVTQYETGRAVPKAERLELLASSLGVTVEWLLTGGEPDELVRAQTKSEEEALALIRQLPVEHQLIALASMRGMIQGLTRK